ncbi:aminotransferase class I/II-fold pyridoxal phosphate-dependent enzyme [Melghirimyces algeriensis]|uniref:Arginine/lysine/ornithine decarboxylase n=1 Tax=Melghirimyces algeriensis TaxID=910412 RepID=A0A521ED10_9BACL|nr:aminotransferase class I/II-fold pyridoxal phosphate-dependent enzyme [Melghirimyces algeriensis]SMO81816.1 Arginine/lysine/ornithine decarboxylase [Melghirimyces algeriensis]
MKDQTEAPLFQALLHHKNEMEGNFHVPGHKQGQAFDVQGRKWFKDILSVDLTEVGELDDLHDPSGAILDAQTLAAEAFGADQTHFLVGGSTAGNLALILGTCRAGDRLIVHRSSHQSVFHGCILAGVRPVFLSGRGHEPLGGQLQATDLENMLSRYPEAKGVLITSPDYFGRVQPVSDLSMVCQRFGVPLMVDEAHGAHFGFHPSLPKSALRMNADGVVQSTHKMLPAMTMASMLHLQGDRLDREQISYWLKVIQSSSPSYPLMASLDLARRFLVQEGKVQLQRIIEMISQMRKKIWNLEQLTEDWVPGSDPLKICIRSRKSISGYRLLQWLEDRKHSMEMADHEKVLAVMTVGTNQDDVDRLTDLLYRLDREMVTMEENQPISIPENPWWSECAISLDQLRMKENERVSLDQAVNRISAAMVTPYPPGIPLVLPGETFTQEKVTQIRHVLDHGGRVRGLTCGFPPKVSVIQ